MVCEEGAAEEERRMKRRRRVVQNQKQEPHTKMWGIMSCLDRLPCVGVCYHTSLLRWQ